VYEPLESLWPDSRKTGLRKPMNREECESILSQNMSKIAASLKKKYNLLDIKHGFDHVASSHEVHVKMITPLFGLNTAELSEDDLIFLCWVAVPIDDCDYVIKVDSRERSAKLNSSAKAVNRIDRMFAADEYMKGETEIDEVEQLLIQRTGTYVFAGSAIFDNKIEYRRLGWLSQPS
jgi:hypothetical protein